jgi:serine/threonine protein kinase
MATPTADVAEYVSLLSKSKLLPQEEVDAVVKRWQDESGSGGSVEAFSKYLVSKRILTPWQAAMVQRGRADGFFLERYKILDQIGKGQMGGVYKAVHSLGQMVALKILPASRAKDPRVLGRFQREARLLTQLDHPNVVRAFQVGDSGGRHFIVMEFLEGETLDDVLQRRKKLPVPEAVRLIRQALDGLQHLEDKRMVHRDLKPANLMIIPAGGKGDTTLDATVKIVDIGLGRELFDESAPEGQIDTQLTVEGAVVGTPDYMSPEQAKDARSADIRADIYSLGCVLYRAVTGRTPFPDTNIMTQMLRHATEMPQAMSKFTEVPAGLQETLDMMIAKRPEDRFQTPAQGSEALKRFQTPGSGAEAAKSDMAPAFKQWLETESHASPEPVKPKTAPAPALPPPPKPVPTPYSAPRPVPVPAAPPRPAPQAYPAPQPQWQPQPIPYPKTPSEVEVDVELVSLPGAAPVPAPQPMPYLEPAEPTRRGAEPERPLTDLNRRDLMLLAMGGGGVVAAMAVGFTLTRLLRGTTTKPAPTGDEKKD